MLETFKGASEDALAAIREEMEVRKTKEVFLLFSMGSQFDHLIMLAMGKIGVFCLVADPSTVTAADVRRLSPKGIILSGGPASVCTEPPPFDNAIFDIGIPILGICLGFQMWANHVGIPVVSSEKREFSTHVATILDPDWPLFTGCGDGKGTMNVLQSHGDRIEPGMHLLDEFEVVAETENASVAAGWYRNLYGVQFHPEVTETEHGLTMLDNFCFRVCGAQDRYPAARVAEQKIAELREQIGDSRVLLALSGGSDSSCVAYLLKHALAGTSNRVRAVYIRGVDRPDDEAHVLEYFGNQDWLELKIVDATDLFLEAVAGKTSMGEKRIAMRGVYQMILNWEVTEYGARFIVQGTLYTDLSESGLGYATGARKAVIKIHHNTGLQFSVPELVPFADCVKDGVRGIGREIGVPEALLTRHPFPGPGLLLRVEGEVTRKELPVAHKADGIFIEELRRWDLYRTVWQAGAVLINSEHTSTKGDDAGKGRVVTLWAVWSVNGFTARAAELPWDFLRHVSRRITNEIREVASVDYRISDKPPATIEWG